MKMQSTDQLLTLGMALTTDRKTMERRVRGVFARKKSAKGIAALSLVLALALGFSVFTTACQPGRTSALSEAKATEMPLYLQEEILTSAENNLRARVLRERDAELEFNSTFPAPRIGDYDYHERGSWNIVKTVRPADEKKAIQAFLDIANEIFFTGYQAADVTATYYRDESKVRADIWRMDSTDGNLNGALDAKTLQFISAQCKTTPRAKQHESILSAGKSFDSDTQESLLNSSSAVSRIASALGSTVDPASYSSYQSSNNRTYGWDVSETVQFRMDNEELCTVLLFGDERLTPYAVAVYSDVECFLGGVYWYADRGLYEQPVKRKDPVDFRIGEPDKDDMTLTAAMERYNALLRATGDNEKYASPVATFYRDYSGARENFWHLSAADFSVNIASKSEHLFELIAKEGIGQTLNLPAVAFSDAVEAQYEAETKRILEATLGESTIVSAEFDSISDDTNCSVVCETASKDRYLAFYSDRLLSYISYYPYAGAENQGYYENWLADYTHENIETGEVFLSYD